MLDIFEEVVRMRAAGERGALATVVSTRGSTPGKETMRLLVRESGSFVGSVGGGCVEAEVVDAAREVIETETPRRLVFRLTEAETGSSGLLCGGEVEVFLEPISIPALYLFGAGHVSQDLCEFAARAGFRVTVIDDRASFANAERFPHAREFVVRPDFPTCFEALRVSPGSYGVVVTRGHSMDLECTEFALRSPAAYVGLIGSRVKVRAIVARLRDSGRLAGVDLRRLHAPIGLDLGGATHGEIALAIAAELVAHRRRRLEGLARKGLPLEEIEAVASRPPRRLRAERHEGGTHALPRERAAGGQRFRK
jgi:xanthine dehydrogenase accessory factor